jgi:hypothetical protein
VGLSKKNKIVQYAGQQKYAFGQNGGNLLKIVFILQPNKGYYLNINTIFHYPMKVLLLVICASLTYSKVNAQLFITIDPSFLKVGLLYNQNINKSYGLYCRGEYGDKKGYGFYTENVKVAAGISFNIPIDAKLHLGINYNYYFNHTNDPASYKILNKVAPVMCEIGITKTVDRFSLLFLLDPYNWESLIGLSYQLHKH